MGSILGQGAKVLHAAQHGQKVKINFKKSHLLSCKEPRSPPQGSPMFLLGSCWAPSHDKPSASQAQPWKAGPSPQLARPPCAYASELSLLLCFAHCLGFPTFISDSSHLAPTPVLRALRIQPYYHLVLTTFSSSQTQAADVVLLLYDYPVLIKIMSHALSNPGGWTVWTRTV